MTIRCANCHTDHVRFGSPSLQNYATHSFLQAMRKRVTVVMPVDLHKRLKLTGINRDQTMNAQILRAVEEYLMKYGSK